MRISYITLATLTAALTATTGTEEKQPTTSPNSHTNSGLTKKTPTTNANCLKKLLADEYILYTKTYKFHWNVTGANFNELHTFFKAQYEQLETFIDTTAERIRVLGSYAPGTLTEFTQLTRLKEDPGTNPPAQRMIARLLADHEAIITSLQKDLATTAENADLGTNNMLNDLLMKHEKMAWMLRAYLQD